MKNVLFAIILFIVGAIAALFVQKHTSWFTPSNVEYEDSIWFSEQLEKHLPIVQKKLAAFSDVHDVITYKHERECRSSAEQTFMQMTNQQIINAVSVILRSKSYCTIEEIVQEYNSYRHVYDGLPEESTMYNSSPEKMVDKQSEFFRQRADSIANVVVTKPSNKDTICGQ